ncbi:hypothetical protein ACWD11_06705 [Streptomyces sp. NPDC002776]
MITSEPSQVDHVRVTRRARTDLAKSLPAVGRRPGDHGAAPTRPRRPPPRAWDGTPFRCRTVPGIYPSAKALDRKEVLGFVECYVEDYKAIAEDAQFIPLNSEQETELKAAIDKLKAAAG